MASGGGNGNVGIGATAPTRLLSLSGPQSVISLYNSGTTTWTGIEMLANNGTLLANIGLDDASGRYGINMKSDGTEDFTITQNGNVGIGTAAPSSLLTVNGGAIEMQSAGVGKGYVWYDLAKDYLAIGRGAESNSIFITNGNVGIGTTTPYTTLTVGSTDATARITAGGPNTHLTLASAGPNGDIYLNAGGVASGNYSTSTRLSVGANGNVGIGTTSPAELLQVGTESAGPTVRKTIKIGSGGYSAPAAFQTNSNGDKIILYNADGFDARIGIGGSTDMWFKSANDGTGGQFKWYTGADANLIMQLSSGSLSMAGGAYCNGTTWVNASDSRLKRDIQPMSKYGLNTVMQLKPVTYFYKADKTNHPEVGFIAQEVQKIVPEVVSGTEGDITKGETLGLSYGNLVPVLTKAIQEQQAEIEAQQKQIDKLTKMVEELMKK